MSKTKETVDRKSTDEVGLKPCPFCGHKPVMKDKFTVVCEKCGAEHYRINWQSRPYLFRILFHAKKAEAMVERLLVAGRDLLRVTDEDFPKVSERWISLVEEWEGKDD